MRTSGEGFATLERAVDAALQATGANVRVETLSDEEFGGKGLQLGGEYGPLLAPAVVPIKLLGGGTASALGWQLWQWVGAWSIDPQDGGPEAVEVGAPERSAWAAGKALVLHWLAGEIEAAFDAEREADLAAAEEAADALAKEARVAQIRYEAEQLSADVCSACGRGAGPLCQDCMAAGDFAYDAARESGSHGQGRD